MKSQMDVTGKIEKLKRKGHICIQKGKYEKALALMAVSAHLLYAYNQKYSDIDLERQVLELSNVLFDGEKLQKVENRERILFYDGFGLDTRGLALIFLEALIRKNYSVVYVTHSASRGKQPSIDKLIEGHNVEKKYIDMSAGYLSWIKDLDEIFHDVSPKSAFFYTMPDDVAAAVVFNRYKGYVDRYQIDLTDHAFWLGLNAFDYCIQLRSVGASISYNYRKIEREKLKMLPYYAPIDYTVEFAGFPFPTEGKRVIFSGGALYKTLGDENNLYYRIVGAILEQHSDILFVYAGTGDNSELLKLMDKYPGRVHHIAERKDLYQVMRQSVLYLNTYPMFGGLMMHYAAAAERLPITLRHNHDADGLLFNQDQLGIEFDTMDELLADVDKLLTDGEYLKGKQEKLVSSVITEEMFADNLQMLIEKHETEFDVDVNYIDTSDFIKEYVKRFNYEKELCKAVAKKRNKTLVLTYPTIFLKMILKKICN